MRTRSTCRQSPACEHGSPTPGGVGVVEVPTTAALAAAGLRPADGPRYPAVPHRVPRDRHHPGWFAERAFTHHRHRGRLPEESGPDKGTTRGSSAVSSSPLLVGLPSFYPGVGSVAEGWWGAERGTRWISPLWGAGSGPVRRAAAGPGCPPGEVYTDPDVVACTWETLRRHGAAPPVAQPTHEQFLTVLAR